MSGAVEIVIEPRLRDLGGFSVRRVLPDVKKRAVGPFIFFDHMGPARFPAGEGIDVGPHPHICLATVTYLFEGEIIHRDSLGHEQAIRPGDVNWMTAGRGIVHSERTGDEERARDTTLHGIQLWAGLPTAHEETEPGFFHHPKDALPVIDRDGVTMRLIAGSAYGATAPVETFSEMFYVDAEMSAGASVGLTDEHEQRCLYVASGAAMVAGERYGEATMVVFKPGAGVEIGAGEDSRIMLLGGAPLDGPSDGKRNMWWNFAASDKSRIEQAKTDWKEGRFDPVPGETEMVPLPED